MHVYHIITTACNPNKYIETTEHFKMVILQCSYWVESNWVW